jgi:adhesin transport system membrane fusion protein
MASKLRWEDHEFISDIRAGEHLDVNPVARAIAMAIVLFFACALLWAYFAELDEVTVGDGKVIPSGQIQTMQNLEGGILAELLVREGDIVERGQILLRIDDTPVSSSFRESQSKEVALRARIARLEAEVEGKTTLQLPEDIQNHHAELAANELQLFNSRRQELESNTGILRKQVSQKEQELVEVQATRVQIGRKLALSRKELSITEPMVQQGVMSDVELLRLKRDVVELESHLEAASLSVPRIEMALREARDKANEPAISFRTKALRELNESRNELNASLESSTALKDRVTRTLVRSPVKGSIIRVRVNTIGQVVRAGMDLVEIMPLEESLLVEAKIRPADIAFLHPGQSATVKFTAYDFSIYGGLPGKLSHISSDAIVDERGEHGESFYMIQVRTERNHLGSPERPLPIIPGMVASVDIMTGKKTVLEYMIKPIIKVQQRALRER